MTSEQKQQLLTKLEKEKINLEAKIVELRELTRPIAPDCSIGRVSRMDAINNKSINEAALRKAEEKIKTIRFALEDIHKPDFGKCRQCGEEIQFGRLMVMPGSSLCVRCARR